MTIKQAGLGQNQHFLLLVVSLTMFGGLTGVYAVPMVVGVTMDSLGYDSASAGLLGTLEIGGTAISSMLVSLIIARVSLRKLVFGACFVAGAAQFLSMLASDYNTLASLRLLAGFGEGALMAVATNLVAVSADPDRGFGRVFAINNIAASLMLLALPFAAAIAMHRGVFAVMGCYYLLLAPLLGLLPDNAKPISDSQEQSSEINWGLVVILIIAFSLLYGSMGGVYSFSERVGANAVGLAPQRIGVFLALSSAVGILGSALAGWLGIRLGRALTTGLGIGCCGLAGIVISNATTVSIYALGLLIYGLMYMFTIAYMLGAASLADKDGRVAVAMNGYLMIAFSVGPWLFGNLLSTNDYTSFGWPALIACGGAALVLLPFIGKPKGTCA